MSTQGFRVDGLFYVPRKVSQLRTKNKQRSCQGRNMVYPGPIDPDFLAVILIPEPLFPQNFDP